MTFSLSAFLVALAYALLWRWGLRLAAWLWDRAQPTAVYSDVPQDLPPYWKIPRAPQRD